jgi:hypothetical protein
MIRETLEALGLEETQLLGVRKGLTPGHSEK